MPQDAIPMTKRESFEAWARDAYARISRIREKLEAVQTDVRIIVQEGSMRGRLEKRLARSIEHLEDEVNLFDIILLGPETSQEERDAF